MRTKNRPSVCSCSTKCFYFVLCTLINKQERLQCFCNDPEEPSEEYPRQLCNDKAVMCACIYLHVSICVCTLCVCAAFVVFVFILAHANVSVFVLVCMMSITEPCSASIISYLKVKESVSMPVIANGDVWCGESSPSNKCRQCHGCPGDAAEPNHVCWV